MSGGGDNEVKETEAQKSVARIASERWNEFVKYGIPARTQFAEKAQMKGKDYDQAAGYSNIDANQAFARQPVVQPQGDVATNIARTGEDKGDSISRNLVASGVQTDDRHMQGKMAIVDAGMGRATSALSGLTDDASRNLSSAIGDARSSHEQRQRNIDTGFGVAGMAARGTRGAMERPNYDDGTPQQGPRNSGLRRW